MDKNTDTVVPTNDCKVYPDEATPIYLGDEHVGFVTGTLENGDTNFHIFKEKAHLLKLEGKPCVVSTRSNATVEHNTLNIEFSGMQILNGSVIDMAKKILENYKKPKGTL